MNLKRVSIATQVSQGKGLLLMLVAMFAMFATDLFAQDYTLSLRQRRLGDQIGVEVWMKKNSASAATVSNMTVPVTYNTDFLQPATVTGYNLGSTDSVDANVEQTTGDLPYRTITSSFDNLNQYASLTGQAADNGTVFINQLQVNIAGSFPWTGGFDIEDESISRGSFVGMLRFDIINHAGLGVDDMTGIGFNVNGAVSTLSVYNSTGASILADVDTIATPAFGIKGISILNPQGPNEAVNRNKTYSSMDVAGYPIYFERSGLITPSATKRYGTANELAYKFSYSTDNSTDTSGNTSESWVEVFRVSEERGSVASQLADTANYRTGEVVSSNGLSTGYWLTQGDGSQLPTGTGDGYGGVLRVMWDDDPFFAPRSEEARLMIQHLRESGSGSAISARNNDTAFAISNQAFILSRLFFIQFDGTEDFVKSDDDYTNSTQLTVEAWVNLNSISSSTVTREPGIVALSNGPEGKAEEGAWILYLKDGKYPAFRAREFFGGVGRGENDGDYIATVVSPDAIDATSDAVPITDAHSNNWHHIAATVADNVVSLYVDGELIIQTTNTNKTDIRMPISVAPIWVAVNPNGTVDSEDYLHAGIKEVRVWRKALSHRKIREFMSGVSSPASYAAGDDRASLQYYWSLAGVSTDLASASTGNQEGANNIEFYEDITQMPLSETALSEERYPYRPDKAHVRITSPSDASGVSNLTGSAYPVRYASYGMGDNASSGSDLILQFSRDGGLNWDYAIDENGLILDDIDVEDAEDNWEPYRSASVIGRYNDLQAVAPGDSNFDKQVRLKITGTTANNQDDISFTTSDFSVAPFFALRNTGENSIVVVENSKELNLLGGSAVLEAWIRPYRFPTAEEQFFPIINKTDTLNGTGHYSLRLLETGQVQFKVWDASNNEFTSTSSLFQPIDEPKTVSDDSSWTHVAVYLNLGNGTAVGSVKMYIDGNVQTGDTLTETISTNVISVNDQNNFDTYIGFEDRDDIVTVDPIDPLITTTTIVNKSFIGELKGIRYWNGLPGGVTSTGDELTNFIRGVSGVKASELLSDYRDNLIASFDMDGGAVVAYDKEYNSVFSVISGATDSLNAKIIVNNGVDFVGLQPMVKVVEPKLRDSYTQDETAMKVRWVGFNYDRGEFITGDATTSDESDLEFSSKGGGNTSNDPFNTTASDNDVASFTDAFTLPLTTAYKFPGTNPPHNQFAGSMDVSQTRVSGSTQTYMEPAKFNAILRLQGRATVNSATPFEYGNISTLRDVGPLFTITAPSNFTIRALLEGYHKGSASAFTGNLGTTFNTNGMKVTLYSDQGGTPTTQVATQVSSSDYQDKDPLSSVTAVRGVNGSLFGDIRYVFEDIADSTYFVIVEHQNHLPVMSRYAVPFTFNGDDATTWAIESGWDFQSWEGDSAEVITEANSKTSPPTVGDDYTAWGDHAVNNNDVNGSGGSTGLKFSNGQTSSATTTGLAAMVAGDVVRSGIIDGGDALQVRSDAAADASDVTSGSDLTGDNEVNATDRTIVDNNRGIHWSLGDIFNRANYYGVSSIIDYDPEATGSSNIINLNDVAKSKVYNEMNNSVENNPTKYMKILAKSKTAKASNELLSETPAFVDLTTDVRINATEGLVYLDVFIENTGKEVALGNCTFAFTYNNNSLKYLDLMNTEENLWDDRPDLGYFKLYSAPTNATINPRTNIRTIEIDYNNSKPQGIQFAGEKVPYTVTKVGTLVFAIKDAQIAESYDFNWYKSTALHDVDGEFIKFRKDGGGGVDTEIAAKIVSPNGGESWKVGKSYYVSWTKPSNDNNINIQLSTDNGATWMEINENMLDIKNTAFEYFVENFNSTECLVRLVNQNGDEIDVSDNVFSIEPPAYFITKPASNDPIYTAGERSNIEWISNEPTDVYFEFSANGKDNWTKVTDVVSSVAGTVEWTVPTSLENINTTSAVIKMVEANSNDRKLNASEPFRVLKGTMSFTSPQDGAILTYSDDNPTANVNWIMNNVAKFDLWYSKDAGATWEVVRSNVNAIKRAFDWEIANYTSTQAMLKATYGGDEDLEYDRTGIFEVKGAGTGVEDDVLSFSVKAPYPNPFNNLTKIEFTIPEMSNVTVEAYNAAGLKVYDLGTQLLLAGNHVVNFNGDDLSQGVYYIQITADGKTHTVEVVHEK